MPRAARPLVLSLLLAGCGPELAPGASAPPPAVSAAPAAPTGPSPPPSSVAAPSAPAPAASSAPSAFGSAPPAQAPSPLAALLEEAGRELGQINDKAAFEARRRKLRQTLIAQRAFSTEALEAERERYSSQLQTMREGPPDAYPPARTLLAWVTLRATLAEVVAARRYAER